jgi:phosphatidylserine/phosphatidylglycerophosphate/cardiolipin synthase-like enzyme
MTPDDIERMLRTTLEDRRLSRSEKRALQAVISEAMLTDDEIAVARRRAFQIAREAIFNERDRVVLDWLEGIVKILAPATDDKDVLDVMFSPGDECSRAILAAFERVERTADVCVFTITDDRLAEAVLAAHARGVTVRVLTDDDKAGDPGSDIERFAAAGIEVRADDSWHHMHHKFAIFDGVRLVTGSYNWTRAAAKHNQENLIVTNDIRLVRAFREAFDGLWEQFGALYAVRPGAG